MRRIKEFLYGAMIGVAAFAIGIGLIGLLVAGSYLLAKTGLPRPAAMAIGGFVLVGLMFGAFNVAIRWDDK